MLRDRRILHVAPCALMARSVPFSLEIKLTFFRTMMKEERIKSVSELNVDGVHGRPCCQIGTCRNQPIVTWCVACGEPSCAWCYDPLPNGEPICGDCDERDDLATFTRIVQSPISEYKRTHCEATTSKTASVNTMLSPLDIAL